MKVLNCLVVWILLFFVPCNSAARSSLNKTLQVQNQLKRLNKPPHKSIKSPDGDIIDCIAITDQPAFDHPLLRNHDIQLRPNYHPEEPFDDKRVNSKSSEGLKPIKQLWHSNGYCDEGTIPVRRTKREDVLRAGSIENYGKKKKNINILHPNSADPDHHQHAIVYVDDDKYYGAKATMNVWQPKVQEQNEFSLSQIWVTGGSFDKGDLNSIEAGWQVSRNLYGDDKTRLFTFWTRDAYKSTGCYNLLCSGFIQINKQIALGASISPLSSYNGSQFDIIILIWKDPDGGNWWMKYGNDQVMGYWPGSLFTNLGDGANEIQWGGEVVNLASGGQHTTTQMGSGHFPEEEYTKASFFKNIHVVDASNRFKVPKNVETFADQSSCYDVQTGKNGEWGTYFYYGGPGRNPKCP